MPISSVFFNYSCRHDPLGLDQIDTVCFDSQILPILQTSCGISGCHGGQGERAEGFSTESYQTIMQIVSPGNASKSKLYEVITAVYGEMMPPNRPLSKEQRTLILVWIEQGAKNTTCTQNGNVDGGNTQYNMDTICFTQNIAPIFQSNCGKTQCHDVTSHKGDYVLTNYNTVMQNREGIVAGNPYSSKIYNVITTSDPEDRMPPSPNPSLTTQQKDLIKNWISDGALNSNCPWTSCDTTSTISFSQQVQVLIQNNCVGCHNPNNTSGGVDLSSHTQIKYYSQTLRNGTPIIVGALRHISGFRPMPPSGILNTCQIRTIELWINQGLQNN